MASKKPKGSNSNNGFDQFKGSMIPTIVRPDQYTNYERAREYVEEHDAGLSCLQRHISDTSVPLRERFLAAFDESKDAVKVFPTLIAASCTKKSIEFADDRLVVRTYKWYETNKHSDNEALVDLLESTGALSAIDYNINTLGGSIKAFCHALIIGMDTNARKNRNGKLMEMCCDGTIKACGYTKVFSLDEAMRTPMTYMAQVSKKRLKKQGVTVNISDNKKVDFAVFSKDAIVLMESNFYSGGGSKLDTICREYTAYKSIGTSADGRDVRFLWCTDGAGWEKHKPSLAHAYAVLGSSIMCTLGTLDATLKARTA